jgi:hypothetical protein
MVLVPSPRHSSRLIFGYTFFGNTEKVFRVSSLRPPVQEQIESKRSRHTEQQQRPRRA